jgi:cobalt-zinc-cadmium efflux system outer membrane protein
VGGSDEDLVISQPIDIFGRRSAARSSGNALVLQAEASLRLVEQELQGDVVAIYIESVAASSRLANAREAEEAAARLLDAIKRLVEGGRLPGVQATRVSIELERARAARKQRESEVAAEIRRLHGVLGVDIQGTPGGFPSIATPNIDERDLILQRADLLLLSADVASAEADIRLARTNRLPQLELQGRRSAWQETDRAYGARIQLSFPLFDSGRSRAEETAARKSAEAARKSFTDLARIARAEIEAARIEVQGAQDQIESLDIVLQTTRDLVSKTQAGLIAGANTLIDVLDAARALREILESLTEARVTLALAQARYLRATGGLLEVRP